MFCRPHLSPTTHSNDVSTEKTSTEKTTNYRYTNGWEAHEVLSDRFKHPEQHSNPRWAEALASASSRTALPFGSHEWRQERVTLDDASPSGPRRLELGLALWKQAEVFTSLAPDAERVRASIGPRSTAHVDGAFVYSERRCAPPEEPHVGCVRLGWRLAPLERVSVIARLDGEQRLVEWPNAAGAGYELALLSVGERGAQDMLAAAASAQSLTTWLKRAAGVLLTWVGWGLVFGPAQYLASWIPLLSGAVGCLVSLVALGIALAHALTIIAVAWVAHRPALAMALLAAAAAALFLGVGTLRTSALGKQQGTSSSTAATSAGGTSSAASAASTSAAPSKRFCTQCGARCEPQTRFCGQCGHALIRP